MISELHFDFTENDGRPRARHTATLAPGYGGNLAEAGTQGRHVL